MDYQLRRKMECKKLFEGFVPNVSGSRMPDVVLRVAELAADGLHSQDIATIVGKSPKAVQKIYRRYNFPRLYNVAPPLMDERPNWKGGEKLMKGYLYRITPDHPNGTKHGNYVAVHRLVVEDNLGRYLMPSEVVDHIDGDITNNAPDNLRVFESNAAHLACTLAGKCPNWTDEGKARLRQSLTDRWVKYRAETANHSGSGTDG